MSDVRIKICGVTNTADARLAASLGADYLGVIFAESPRHVDVARARDIRDAVPSTPLVGVFMDQPIDDVTRIALGTDLDLIQLHGSESPHYCDDILHRTSKPVLKAFRDLRLPSAETLAAFTTTSYFLFDFDRSEHDAERESQTWADVRDARGLGFRVFVAGGVDAANVRDIIARTHAFAVDVCRGVESTAGIKDAAAMERFFMEVRA